MSHMFVPGPVDVAPEVLAAQTKPMIPHRSKDFEAIFQRTEEKAKQLFFTQYRVFQGSCSGSGMQEAGHSQPGAEESVLSCINGSFSQRWNDVAIANGKQADKTRSRVWRSHHPRYAAGCFEKEALRSGHHRPQRDLHRCGKSRSKNLCKVVQGSQPRYPDPGGCGFFARRA